MKCVNHPEIDAVATCAECGKSVCRMCMLTHEGKDYCKKCAVELLSGVEERVKPIEEGKSNKFRYFLISFNIFPGLLFTTLGLLLTREYFIGKEPVLIPEHLLTIVGMLFIVNTYNLFKFKKSSLIFSSLSCILLGFLFLISLWYYYPPESSVIIVFVILPILINLVNLWYDRKIGIS